MSKDIYTNRSNPFNKTGSDQGVDCWNNSRQEDSNNTKMQKMKQEMNESEQRQLDSTQRALASIAESEQIGIATAEELSRQGEQLNNIEQKTHEINQDLKVTQKQIRRFRSPCGRIKDWWYGGKEKETPVSNKELNSKSSLEKTTEENKKSSGIDAGRGFYDDDDDDNYEKSAKGASDGQTQYFKPISKSDQEQEINQNLNKMADGMTRLKGLAVGMGDEIETQNDQLDRINNATADVQTTMIDQNKQIRKILS